VTCLSLETWTVEGKEANAGIRRRNRGSEGPPCSPCSTRFRALELM